LIDILLLKNKFGVLSGRSNNINSFVLYMVVNGAHSVSAVRCFFPMGVGSLI